MAPATNGNGHAGQSLVERDVVPSTIDNAAWEGLSGSYDLNDPHTGELLYKVASVKTADEVTRAVDSAAKAFKTWQHTPASERRRIFQKALNFLEERADEFKAIALKETTANKAWTGVDHYLASNIIEETAATATALKGEIVNLEHGSRGYIQRVPYGIVFGIAPWNAPLTLGVRCFANAIMAGNTVVMKSSEYSPKIHTFAAQLFYDAGLPEGVLNLLHIAPEDSPAVCEAVIKDFRVRKVNFTGSTNVGAKLAELCGKYLKPCTMELGGKAPVIVLKDANLRAAANAVMFGGFAHSGQVCMSSDSLIVHEDVADEFISILREHLSTRPASSSTENPMQLRGVFSQRSADRINGYIDDAVAKGGKVVVGDHSRNEKNVLQPVLVEGVTTEMKLWKEEIFGPAMTLMRFKNVEQAIERANSSEFGLAASVYGSNESECFHIASQIESGQVHINGATIHDTQTVPHGGLKNSGWGRFNGLEGLKEFSTTKTITINHPHEGYPM